MTKAELLDLVHGKVEGLTKKQTSAVMDALFEALSESLQKGERIAYPGFGTFSVKERAAREGRNPKTGEVIQIKASKTVNFKLASKLKDSL